MGGCGVTVSGDSPRGRQLLQKEAAGGEAGLRKQEAVYQKVQTNLNCSLGNTGGQTRTSTSSTAYTFFKVSL